MGLDAYLVRVPKVLIPEDAEVDFHIDPDYDHCREEIHYWRKNWSLQIWMHELYRARGGEDSSFNCSYLRLHKADIGILLVDIKAEHPAYSSPTGYDYLEEDIKFFSELHSDFSDKFAYFYYAWY